MPHTLQAVNISKSYASASGPVAVLHALDFHADENEFISFVGPSGCGKSTLFNIITGLLAPDDGHIIIKNRETTGSPSPDLGYVLQKDLLFPWRTVLENVVLGLEVRGINKKIARERAADLLRTYHMEGFEDKYPAQLSGGMKQRVALMRTMVTEPEIILMDEAYKALDYPLKVALESELLTVVKQQKKTVIFITHDIEEAVTLSDRVYVMKASPGEIVHEIKVDLETDSMIIPERRLSPRFNDYYEVIWRSIGAAPVNI
ncbi:ABC transporter ATP-binding protein [Acerihabitans arboris]|uniref:ATP-binding cassette domain-containing protein n=1 Tax=Acerihabitans arboris TaxID=2691583 RepID=A0A845SF71_9GAMM|nr:ABC transporter ATP-binding protein [Acerihabitans arboris]NDL61736.1 ATP-binding cassette domain-containing protein [Acerihabitans arboris]